MEAQQINIAARYPGRILEFRVREGDVVQPGQVVAVLDARIAGDCEACNASEAMIAERRNALQLVSTEMARSEALFARGFATTQLRDQRRTMRHLAAVELVAAGSRSDAADADFQAAKADADRIREQIAEVSLRAPQLQLASPARQPAIHATHHAPQGNDEQPIEAPHAERACFGSAERIIVSVACHGAILMPNSARSCQRESAVRESAEVLGYCSE